MPGTIEDMSWRMADFVSLSIRFVMATPYKDNNRIFLNGYMTDIKLFLQAKWITNVIDSVFVSQHKIWHYLIHEHVHGEEDDDDDEESNREDRVDETNLGYNRLSITRHVKNWLIQKRFLSYKF